MTWTPVTYEQYASPPLNAPMVQARPVTPDGWHEYEVQGGTYKRCLPGPTPETTQYQQWK